MIPVKEKNEREGQSKLRLLLAEDNPDHRFLLTRMLTANNADVEVRAVSDGKECLEAFGSFDFDCLILDYTLPDYMADDLLRDAAEKIKGRPVIVISSSSDQSIVIASFRGGSVDFVPKIEAMTMGALLPRVEKAVSAWRGKLAERRREERRLSVLRKRSETDELTGLSNRHYFDRLIKETPKCDRRRLVGWTLFDIDHFKQINDRFGHAHGDNVLREVAQTIRRHLGNGSHAMRWGGEEFLVLQPAQSLAECWLWAERVRKAILGAVTDLVGDPITVSAGVARKPNHPLDYQTVHLADQALYLAKQTGRNRVCTWNMSVIEQRLQWVEKASDGPHAPKNSKDFDWKRRELLLLCANDLGPTQREHVDDHCIRVSRIAGEIAKNMALGEEATKSAQAAGLLHDIGKLLVPEDLLGKPSGLSNEERAFLGIHAEEGARISERLGADPGTVESIRQHHTPFHGNENDAAPPMGARIVAAADALTAMTSNRVYRAGQSKASALVELGACAGGQFDPAVVKAVQEMARVDLIQAA